MMIYRFVSKNAKQPLFIMMSMIFLAISDIISATGMIIVAIIIALYGRLSKSLRKKKILFLVTTIINILLCVGSFIGWSIYNSTKFENANSFLRFCPIGASFFFLQAFRFTIDVYTGRINGTLFVNDSLDYLLFYPRLVMGPVMTYNEHRQMLINGEASTDKTGEGLSLLIKGLSKKLLLADTIGLVFFPLYGNLGSESTLLMSWLTVLAFAVEFYFTVAGYGDMAKGVALCYGFDIPESYKYPLLSGSFSRFDNEWNISIVSWIKELFSPMLRNNKWQYVVGMILVWTIIGFWYGPHLNVIIFGIWLGLWIGLERVVEIRCKHIPKILKGLVFFIITFLGWMLFMSDSLLDGVKSIGLLLGSSANIASSKDFYYLRSSGVILIIAAYSATGNFNMILERMSKNQLIARVISVIGFAANLFLFILCIIVLVTSNDITALQFKGAM